MIVEEIHVKTEISATLKDRGFPCVLEQGKIEIVSGSKKMDHLISGDMRLIPVSLRDGRFVKI